MKRYIEEVIIALYLILIVLMVWGIWHYWIDPTEDSPIRDNSTHTTNPTRTTQDTL